MSSENNIIEEKLKKEFPKAVLEASTFRNELTVFIAKDSIVEVSKFLRDDPDLNFDFLSDLCGVDKTPSDNTLEVVYHLYSINKNHRVRLKAKVPTSKPNISSVVDVWKTADWHEREAYDLVGIIFDGHPDLRRILTPDGFEGHPLRKDYPLKGRQSQTMKSENLKGKK